MCNLPKRLHTHEQTQWPKDRVHPQPAATAALISHSQLVGGDSPTCFQAGWPFTGGVADLELGADAGRLLLLVEVEQGLGDAVRQRQVAEVLQGLHVDQVLQA